MIKRCTVGVVALALLPSLLRSEIIFREGEDPTESAVHAHPWWYDKVKADELSGGKWISNFSDTDEGTASYRVSATEGGTYALWVRANPTAASLGWKLNDGAEKDVDFSGASDVRNIAEDGKIDLRFIGWTRVADVTLKKGENTLAFRFHSSNSNHGALDCFVLTNEQIHPTGKEVPKGEGKLVPVDAAASSDPAAPASSAPRAGGGEPGGWPFDVPKDGYTKDALLDLSMLNEGSAGQRGFVKLSSDGMSFVDGAGKPLRFWSVVSGGVEMKPEDMEEHCRFLAKRGINNLRLHLNLPNTDEGAKITDLNEKQVDNLYRFISIAKKHGLYITLSPYWAHMTAPKSWGIDDYGGQQIWGLMFFNPELQAAYREWTRKLYTTRNPYTGVALKDEPAIAILQVKNEDSLLFYTFQGLRPAQKKLAGQLFAQWAMKKYGSLEKAQAAWSNVAVEGDDIPSQTLGFHLIWSLTQPPPSDAGTRQRMADQTQFLAETQYRFYDMVEKHLRTLGCRQLTNAMNWKSADPIMLDDAERWSYTANEVMAVNYYTGGLHVGENNGYRVDPGHYLTNASCLKDPSKFPGNLKQAVGHPFIITEVAWTHPNLYQSEGPFMAAAYMSLTGVDSFYWFATGEPNFLRDPRRMWWKVGSSYALDKWSCATPTAAAQWPAYALAYRKGYIAPADRPVVYEERSLDDLWQRRIPAISESGRFDPNRDAGSFASQSPVKQEINRLAFMVGPVYVKYGGNPANTRVENLSAYIDDNAGTVRSVTGQILLNHKQGVMTVAAPKFQGVAGFLKDAGGSFSLPDVTVSSENHYAVLGVVPLDDAPIASSRRLLVQVGTTSRLTGFQTRQATFKADNQTFAGEQIVNTGAPPWRVANTQITLTLKNPNLTKATLLDPNGYAAGPVEVKKDAGGVTLTLPENTLYLIVQ